MNKMKFKILFIAGFLLSTTVIAQNWKTVPDVFTTQCKTSFINKVNNGEVRLQDLPSNDGQFWTVYSDRENNRLKNKAGGSNNGETLDFLESLFVKDLKDNWLHVYSKETNREKGWIESKYLLLSRYSLKTDGNISIPRKAIILTALDDVEDGSKDDMERILKQKKWFKQPDPKKGTVIGTPNSFSIYFIMKDQDGSVLLSTSDILGNRAQLESSVKGWMPKSNIEKWNSRVALEPSRTIDAIDTYSDLINGKREFHKLPGYKKLSDLTNCIKERDCHEDNVVSFRVGKIPSNRMRHPILTSIDDNVKQIISIVKNSIELDPNQQDIYKDLLEQANYKSQMTNIVFAVDATSSMRPYFSAIASSINKIIDNNEQLNQHKLKFGLVVYRDYEDRNDAYSYESLSTDFKKIQKKVNNTQCFSNDVDLPEAQYNGLIKGIEKMDFDPTESNVVILIGDCGNHIPDPKGLRLNDVVKVFHKNSINLISYQVKNNLDDSYFTFNDDAHSYITETAERIIEGLESTLKPKMIPIGVNSYKLDMQEGEDDFVNMFGRFIYANANSPMKTTDLEESIVKTLSEYMKTVDDNIITLNNKIGVGPSDVITGKPTAGMIAYVRIKFKCTEKEAIDFLNKTEVTTKAFVAIDYNASGFAAQVPVVFLSENEKNTLVKSLRKLNDNDCTSTADKKKCLKENLIEVCKSILGPKTSTETIQELSMQEIWKIIVGIDFEDKKLKNVKLIDIHQINNRDFREFYSKFELKSEEFCEKGYEHSNIFESRRFSLNSMYFYWIPLEDLPGTE